jgi:Ca2+/Na+ antiporter
MFLAGVLVTAFMKSDRTIKKIEGLLLILAYLIFVIVELFVNKVLSF